MQRLKTGLLITTFAATTAMSSLAFAGDQYKNSAYSATTTDPMSTPSTKVKPIATTAPASTVEPQGTAGVPTDTSYDNSAYSANTTDPMSTPSMLLKQEKLDQDARDPQSRNNAPADMSESYSFDDE